MSIIKKASQLIKSRIEDKKLNNMQFVVVSSEPHLDWSTKEQLGIKYTLCCVQDDNIYAEYGGGSVEHVNDGRMFTLIDDSSTQKKEFKTLQPVTIKQDYVRLNLSSFSGNGDRAYIAGFDIYGTINLINPTKAQVE